MGDLKSYKHYCFVKGSEEEERYKIFMKSKGYWIEKTEYIEDRYKHIDFRMFLEKEKLYILDFKGGKEGHKLGMNGYTWIETKNVEGKVGWFNAKNLNSVVFELPDRYILVDIIGLREFCDKMVKIINETSINKPINDYVLYQRHDRFDVIFRMPFSHIEKYIIEVFMK